MFITAAPVGAIPKRRKISDLQFISLTLIDTLSSNYQKRSLCDALLKHGWEKVNAGGMSLHTNGKKSDKASHIIGKNILSLITNLSDRKHFIINLSSQEWIYRKNSLQLITLEKSNTYLSPDVMATFGKHESLVRTLLLEHSWMEESEGFFFSEKNCSPYLPIHVDEIIKETLNCFKAGASIVHLHTRDISESFSCYFPSLKEKLTLSTQKNKIDSLQFKKIVEGVFAHNRESILNLSTSIRGQAFQQDDIRRSHLSTIPPIQIASISPGPVIFQGGTGYDNKPDFIRSQLQFFDAKKIIPEVEVFGRQILLNACTIFLEDFRQLHAPPLFMLVVGVDTFSEWPSNNQDNMGAYDALLSYEEKAKILFHIHEETPCADQEATQIAYKGLKESVKKIRKHYPRSFISMLMVGPLHKIICQTAKALELDGVRVGMEDSLNIYDKKVPGGFRRAFSTAEQVELTRKTLSKLGVKVIEPKSLKRKLFLRND